MAPRLFVLLCVTLALLWVGGCGGGQPPDYLYDENSMGAPDDVPVPLEDDLGPIDDSGLLPVEGIEGTVCGDPAEVEDWWDAFWDAHPEILTQLACDEDVTTQGLGAEFSWWWLFVPDGCLIKSREGATIYLMHGRSKHAIPNYPTMQVLGWKGGAVFASIPSFL
ncbi:MAG: hypothetical protein AB7Y46_08040 [Armatimonadota bacterium]